MFRTLSTLDGYVVEGEEDPRAAWHMGKLGHMNMNNVGRLVRQHLTLNI